MSMENCWAACLGDCDGGMSREHIISKSLFAADVIQVSGYPWCKDGPKQIGLASFTKKALCRKHNSDLSPIDDVGAHAFEVFRQHTHLSIERGKEPSKKYRRVSFAIDARRLEMWLLKTLINISYGGEYCVGPVSQRPGFPSDDLVKAVFRGKRLPIKNGLQVVSKPGMDLHMSDRVEMSPLLKDNTHIHGAFFKFFGFPIFFDLVPGGLKIPFELMSNVATDWHHTARSVRFQKFQATVRGRLSHTIVFNWRK